MCPVCVCRMEMESDGIEMAAEEISKYSVVVGFLLILVFVAPCITLALTAKCFQKQGSTSRKVRTRWVG